MGIIRRHWEILNIYSYGGWFKHFIYIRGFVSLKCFVFQCPGVFAKPCKTIGIKHLILQLVSAKEKENGLAAEDAGRFC